jgi:hypothetical protein
MPDEIVLKTHSLLDESTSITPNVTDMLEKNALSICVTGFNPTVATHQSRSKFSRPKITKTASFKAKLGRAMHKLHNLEGSNELEKHLDLDLGKNLYQMEDY